MHVDSLYLGTNDIVNPCVHPEEQPQPQNKEKIFINMGTLINRLVLVICLYMLLCGVLLGTV